MAWARSWEKLFALKFEADDGPEAGKKKPKANG
jgi:hypothetical protein